MNDPRPAFLFHVRDFWTAECVETMTAADIGVYLFLLCRQWETGSIPADAAAVLRLCSSIAGVAHADVERVLAQFPVGADGRRRNARMEFERSLADERSVKASNKAKERWDRWRGQKQCSVDAVAVPQHKTGNAAAEDQQCHGNAEKGREEKVRKGKKENSALTRGPSTDPESKKSGGTPSTRHWDAEWGRTRPVAWSWQPKDFAALGKCLELAEGSHEEVCRRITILLESKDGFHIKAASPGILLSQWSNLGFEVHPVSKGDAQILEIMRQAAQPRGSIFDLSQPLPGEVLS